MSELSRADRDTFWRDGCLVIPDAISPTQLAVMRAQFQAWVDESRQHTDAYGQMIDGRARFDLQPGHTADKPTLRRVASPTELSEDYLAALTESRMVDVVAELLGPDLRFHHSKINSKLPGSATEVKWHQDFSFDPHSNDDAITTLVFLDEVTAQNGPLQVVPGSHRGPIYSLWHDGRFTGAVDEALVAGIAARARDCTGPAGAACLMHTRLLHGSSPNLSDHPRTLFICNLVAADAVPLVPNPVPCVHAGMLVRGREPGRVRCIDYEMQLPEHPKVASFFAQQAGVGG